MEKVNVAIIGPGNIGTDLMYKVMRSEGLHMKLMAGIIESDGIRRAQSLGIETTSNGIKDILSRKDIQIVLTLPGQRPIWNMHRCCGKRES